MQVVGPWRRPRPWSLRRSRRRRWRPGCRAPGELVPLPRICRPGSPSCTTLIRLACGVDRALVDRPADDRVHVDCPGSSSGSSPCSRDSSMICCTRRVEPGALGLHPAGEPLTASGSSEASWTASASRLSAPTGVLSSWLHVGDEVAADRLDAALAGAVLDQRQHQPAAERCDPRGHVQRRDGPAARHHQLGLADLPVPAYLPDQLGELVDGHLVAADQPERVRRSGGLEDLVLLVDDQRTGAQDGEHGRRCRRARRAPRRGVCSCSWPR